MLLTLDAAGLLKESSGMTRGALRLLFNGGTTTGKGDASVLNIDRWRELCTIFPVLPLFGGCIDNGPKPGQINVDALNLICTENLGVMPRWVKAWLEQNNEGICSWRPLTARAQRVTMDPELVPEKVKLLSEGEQIAVYDKQRLRELAHQSGDSKMAKQHKSTMMPRSFQHIISGALLWGAVEARTYNDVEFDAFNYVFAGLISNFRVGGMGREGFGKLTFLQGHQVPFTLQPQIGKDLGDDLAGMVGTLFRARIAERKDDIAQWLRGQVNS
jgi:hypothetical protein